MSARKLIDSLANLEKTVFNLEQALTYPTSQELVVEGSIQRFETAVELFWKTLGRALEYEGFEERTPRHCVKEAFKLGWLDDENAWLEILDRRNITTHEYLSSELVMDYYRTIKDLAPEIRKAFDKLRERYASLPGDAD